MGYFRILLFALVATTISIFHPAISAAQTPPSASAGSALEAAEELLEGKALSELDTATLHRIRNMLDQILDEFPESDIAVRILFQDTLGELDVAELDRLISANLLGAQTPAQPLELESNSEILETDTSNGDDFVVEMTIPLVNAPRPSEENGQTPPQDAGQLPADVSDTEAAVDTNSSRINPFDISAFPAEFRQLALSLNQCYARDNIEGEPSSGTVAFEIGSNGQLVGVPLLVEGRSTGQNVRTIYLNAMIALEDCSPYPLEVSGQKLEAEFDQQTLIGLLSAAPIELPWEASTREAEAELDLDRAAIAAIQARLELLGFDPNGIDGVLGRGSRSAITAWQTSKLIPESGYLDERQLNLLELSSNDMFANWQLTESNQQILERASRPRVAAQRTSRWWRDSRGMYCRRALLGNWCQRARPRNP